MTSRQGTGRGQEPTSKIATPKVPNHGPRFTISLEAQHPISSTINKLASRLPHLFGVDRHTANITKPTHLTRTGHCNLVEGPNARAVSPFCGQPRPRSLSCAVLTSD